MTQDLQLDSAKATAAAVFSDTYFEAREKFRRAAPDFKAYPCSVPGPGGEALTTDVTYVGPADAKRMLVVISATHGPEGYAGSAAQLALLAANPRALLRDTAILYVHALNCYGFAWDRRVTAEGCDLNRNFIDFTQPLPQNPGYAELAAHLLPRDFSEAGIQRADEAIQAFRAKHGDWAFHTARMSGQYQDVGGVGFGGMGPTEARLTLEAIARDYHVASREQVVIVDHHTGLGLYGYGEVMGEEVSGLDGHARALKIFGPSATSPLDGSSSAMALHGTLDEFWQRLLGDRHTYVCLEFGTYDRETSRRVQRSDLALFKYHPEEADTVRGRAARTAAKNHYYPQKDDWKEMVVWRAHQVHRQALEAMAAPA